MEGLLGQVQEALATFVGLLLAMGLAFATQYVRRQLARLEDDRKWDFVATAVRAAEKLYKSGEGTKKLAYVKALLARRGVSVDDPETEAMIQAAVYETGGECSGTE